MKECVFCDHFIPNRNSIFENELAIAYFDEFSVSKGHTLIITKRHAATFLDIINEEQMATIELWNKSKKYIDEKHDPDRDNVGLNCGESASQSVMHIHMYFIPRYKVDVENPRGGVRGVIPNKKLLSRTKNWKNI